MLSQAKVRFMYELHRNKDKLNDEERSDNGDTDVVLLVLTGEKRDEHISDRADTDTVGDRVGQRHHDEPVCLCVSFHPGRHGLCPDAA